MFGSYVLTVSVVLTYFDEVQGFSNCYERVYTSRVGKSMCWGLPVVRLVLVYCKGSHKCYERVSMQALSKGYERSYPSRVCASMDLERAHDWVRTLHTRGMSLLKW